MTDRIRSFAPIVDDNSRILILGSMPGAESLRQQRYYAYDRNAFWWIMCDIFAGSYIEDYYARVHMLRRNHVALWDVLAECVREGSLDSAIQNPEPNDVAGLLRSHPGIRTVLLNGNKATLCFKKYIYKNINDDGIMYLSLPSTSPANAGITYSRKLEAWKSAIIESLHQ